MLSENIYFICLSKILPKLFNDKKSVFRFKIPTPCCFSNAFLVTSPACKKNISASVLVQEVQVYPAFLTLTFGNVAQSRYK